MFDTIYLELLKLKGSKILLLLPTGIMFAIIFHAAALLSKNISPQDAWINTFEDFGMNDYEIPVMISVFISYIFAREYQQNTANSIFACPFSRITILLGKIAVVFLFIITIMSTIFISILCIGMLIIHKPPESYLLFEQFRIFIWMLLLYFSLSMVYALTSIMSKNYIAPVVLAAILIIGSNWVSRLLMNDCRPWKVLYPCTGPGFASFVEYCQTLPYAIFLTLIFVIPFIFSIIYYSKSNVYG